MQQWLQHSPFFILGSYSEDGLDVSPRGDAPGQACRILDTRTIAIPDRLGNNRIETLSNILQDDRIGLIFMIPGVEQALRIKGRARISIDPGLIESFDIDGIKPATVILTDVNCAYFQNARAIRSAQLWDASRMHPPPDLPDVSSLSGKTNHKSLT